MSELLKINNIHKSFGHLEVLKGINFTVNKSDVVCLIGASSSFTTT